MRKDVYEQTQENIRRIRKLFPHCVTEAHDSHGNSTLAVDFNLLRQELSPSLIPPHHEQYQLDWPGKRQALLNANSPAHATLRPYPSESLHFNSTQNLFIEGDNLPALKLLQETYTNKIKLIYIDPPYNTRTDLPYQNHYTESKTEHLLKSGSLTPDGLRLLTPTPHDGHLHSPWLSMLYPRLKLARNLLRNDGILIASIDEKEHANLRKLAALVFGEENFCGDIVWKNSSKNNQRYISIQHEYFVVFVKSKQHNKGDWKEKKEGLSEIYRAFSTFKQKHGDNWNAIHTEARAWYRSLPDSNPIRANKHYNHMDERGVYFPDNIAGPEDGQYTYPILHPETGKPCKMPSSGWRYPESTMLRRIAENRIHFGVDHTVIPHNKTYLHDTEFQSLGSLRIVDGRGASRRLKKMFGAKVFTNPKDERVLKDLFKAMNVTGDDIVMDFFAGSATTMHAVHELNRETGSACRCILMQAREDLCGASLAAGGGARRTAMNAIAYLRRKGLDVSISEIAKERLRLIAKRYEGVGRCDVGFRVLKVDSSNFIDRRRVPCDVDQEGLGGAVEALKRGRSGGDLLFQAMLDCGMDLSLVVRREEVLGREVFVVGEKVMVACFDVGVDEELVGVLARGGARRMVFREEGFRSEVEWRKVERMIRSMCPEVEVSLLLQ